MRRSIRASTRSSRARRTFRADRRRGDRRRHQPLPRDPAAGRRDPRRDVGLGAASAARGRPTAASSASASTRCALAENPFLDEWRVQDLNRNPRLPFATAEFDGATICVAIQHLTRPGEVIREVGRVLKPGSAADRDLLEPLLCRPRPSPAGACSTSRASVPDRPAFRRGRQLDRHSLSRPHPAGRRRAALCGDRPQPRRRPPRRQRLTSQLARHSQIPAQAGIPSLGIGLFAKWIPAFAGIHCLI